MKDSLDNALDRAQAGRLDESLSILQALNQYDPRVQYNLGWHELRRGNFQRGFELLNVGRFIDVFGSKPIPGPIWRDQPLRGKTLLLRGEGGLGDEICNFRFARYFRQLQANVIVSAHSSLLPFFAEQGYPGITHGAIPYTWYDYWVPAMSAGYVLGQDYGDLDGSAYIRAPRAIDRDGQFRIGLRWGGNADHELEPQRKLPAWELINTVAGARPDAALYSFQRDTDRVQSSQIIDLGDKLQDWRDTARWLMAMDLVITSCTSVAHMAGALGVPTWILTPILPYYTWALPGESTPWYDSVTLIRQTQPGDWSKPIGDVSRRLRALYDGTSRRTDNQPNRGPVSGPAPEPRAAAGVG